MKSPIMRKLFFGPLSIFLLLLLFQLGFQTFLFEPYLVSEQNRRLTKAMNELQAAIVHGDDALARHQIEEGMSRGIVMSVSAYPALLPCRKRRRAIPSITR